MSHAVWTGQAIDDLANVDSFCDAVNSEHADRIGRAAIDAGRFLAEHPRAGPVVEGEFRKWRVRGTRYLLVYRLVDEGVEIVRLHHGRENWRGQT